MGPHIRSLVWLGVGGVAGATFAGGLGTGDAVGGRDGRATVAQTEPVNADPVLARWRGGQVMQSEVHAMLGSDLRDLETRHAIERYETIERALHQYVDGALLDAERQRRGIATTEELVVAEVAARRVPPREDEIQATWDRLRTSMPGLVYEDALPTLLRVLQQEQEGLLREAFLDDLRRQQGVVVLLPYPDVARVDLHITDFNPVRGPDNAPVTLVQFADFQCYFCQRQAPVLERLLAAFPTDLRLVYKDFPMPGHDGARRAAVAAHCADQQGRFQDMSRLLRQNPDAMTYRHLRSYGESLGLDLISFDECLHDTAWHDRIDEDCEVGRKAGVASTPTMFINGLMVVGNVHFDELASLVHQELARVRSARGVAAAQ